VHISRTKRAVVGRSSSASEPGAAKYTEDLKRKIAQAQASGDELIAIHKHPNNYPPSYEDLASKIGRDYSKSLTIGHSGGVWCIDSVSSQFEQYHCREEYIRHLKNGHSAEGSARMTLEALQVHRYVSFRRWLQ
jgi:hypothetical protein